MRSNIRRSSTAASILPVCIQPPLTHCRCVLKAAGSCIAPTRKAGKLPACSVSTPAYRSVEECWLAQMVILQHCMEAPVGALQQKAQTPFFTTCLVNRACAHTTSSTCLMQLIPSPVTARAPGTAHCNAVPAWTRLTGCIHKGNCAATPSAFFPCRSSACLV